MIPASVLESIEQHLESYEKLTAGGQLAQAGQELEAIRKENQAALAQSRSARSSVGPTKPAKAKHARRQQ